MLIFYLLIFAVVSLTILFFVTQVIAPIFKGAKMFPMFRNQGKLEAEITDLNQKQIEKQLQEKIDRMKDSN